MEFGDSHYADALNGLDIALTLTLQRRQTSRSLFANVLDHDLS
jgi:hypothetical protein